MQHCTATEAAAVVDGVHHQQQPTAAGPLHQGTARHVRLCNSHVVMLHHDLLCCD